MPTTPQFNNDPKRLELARRTQKLLRGKMNNNNNNSNNNNNIFAQELIVL